MKRHLVGVAAIWAALTLLAMLPAHADDCTGAQPGPCPSADCDDPETPDIVVPGLGTW
jgi:hypothetical protein